MLGAAQRGYADKFPEFGMRLWLVICLARPYRDGRSSFPLFGPEGQWLFTTERVDYISHGMLAWQKTSGWAASARAE